MPLFVTLETCKYGPYKGFSDIYLSTLLCLLSTFQGFPVGTKVDEQDPACVPNAKYTLGEFSVSGISLVFGICYYYFLHGSCSLPNDVIKTARTDIFVLCTALNKEVRGGQLARGLQFCGAVRGVDASCTSILRQY